MNQTFILLLTLFIVGCKSADKTSSDQQDLIDGKVSYIKNDSLSPKSKYDNPNYLDTILSRVKLEESDKKCNLFRADYVFKRGKEIIDTHELSAISKSVCKITHEHLLALNVSQLDVINPDHDATCSFPIMTTSHIYMNDSDYRDQKFVAISSITPSTPNNDVYVRYWVIEKYQRANNIRRQ